MKIIKILTTRHKRRILIDSILWAIRCYRQNLITKHLAIGHVKTAYKIVSFGA